MRFLPRLSRVPGQPPSRRCYRLTELCRIRTSPFGYGKAVYLQLNDGYTVVYGHLDEFAEKLLPVIIRAQTIERRYAVDVQLTSKDIIVNRGEILGFTGDTGTKHPHLHFEIRDSLERPLNPLNMGYRIDDSTIPTIKELAVIPVQARSRINGHAKVQIFPTYYAGKRDFLIQDTINVCGSVAFEVRAYDTVRGLGNKYAPHGIKLFIDDSLHFFVQYDIIDFKFSRYVDIDRDYQLNTNDEGLFNRLWRLEPSAKLPFYQLESTGVVDLECGYHNVVIKVYDHNKNISTLKAVIHFGVPTSPIETKVIRRQDVWEITLEKDSLQSYRDFSAFWVNGALSDHHRLIRQFGAVPLMHYLFGET